jgi:hypothetical protein
MTRAAEWCWILAAFAVLNLSYAGSQRAHPREGLGGEGRMYHDIARSLPRELPPPGIAPFVQRIGTPMLVAGVAKSLDWVISAGFDRLGILFNLVSVVLLALLLQRHVGSLFARFVVLGAFMLAPHSPIRLAYFHPLSIDPETLAWLLAGLVAIEWYEDEPSPRRAGVVAALTAIGVVFHEAVLVIGLAALVVRRAAGWLPVISGAVALWAIHAWSAATSSEFSLAADAVRGKSPWQYAIAWFLVFGPLLAMPLVSWRRTMDFLRSRPAMFVYLAIFAVFAWFRDGETERMLVYASPVVWILVARAIEWARPSPAAAATGAVLMLQALSFRIFSPIGGPIDPPSAGTEIWERLGWAGMSWTLSDANMWTQFCALAMLGFHAVWHGLASIAVIALLRSDSPSISPPRIRTPRIPTAVLLVLGTIAAMAPVAWLALSRFYWTHYDQPGGGYLVYNLARVWMIVVLLAAFWSTGTRIAGRTPFLDAAFCGAAVWSVGVVVLATLHLYYLWLILPFLAVSVWWSLGDYAALRRDTVSHVLSHGPPVGGDWGLAATLLKFAVAGAAMTLLLTIALWGNFGGDNDVPGNYLPYYESVLDSHSNGPNKYWVHFFASKGNGLGLLGNILSDVHGAGLVSLLILGLGAGLIWRASPSSLLALAAVAIYLQFYAGQGAYAKSHIIRNTFVLYLVATSAVAMLSNRGDDRAARLTRLCVIAAVIVLSPLAAVVLMPILLMDMAFLKRSVIYPAWTLLAIVVVCGYNYAAVGLPELHSMPSVVGRFVNVGRFSAWMDPGVAYIDYRLAFVQVALSGSGFARASTVTLVAAQSIGQVLPTLLSVPVLILLAGAAAVAIVSRAVSLRVTVYLVAILALAAALQLLGGGTSSSIVRFTNFVTPAAIVLALLLLWRATSQLRAAALVVAVVALGSGYQMMAAQHWRSSIRFLVGGSSYAAMHDPWDAPAGRKLAHSIASGDRIELLSFLPGFSSVPASPYQHPDGSAYIKDYTKVLYGAPDDAVAIYAAANIKYFLVDLAAEAPLLWSAFAPLFEPGSVRARMRVVSHDVTDRHDIYLLAMGAGEGADFDAFVEKWRRKREGETAHGVYYGQYEAGRTAARRVKLGE